MNPSSYFTNHAGCIGTWSLDSNIEFPPTNGSFSTETTQETVFEPDFRSRVDQNDYKDNGKYRSVVKLVMRFEGQRSDDDRYAVATGWLVSPSLVVTAGHNVYNWISTLGRAVHIKCYIGYQGRDSINDPSVQYRVAKRIVTTAEWLASSANGYRDVAFIQVDRPFLGKLRVFSYKSTPKTGHEMLGVVGYPVDKYTINKDGIEERGSLMYEEFGATKYSLQDQINSPPMLRYNISTFQGQSGSPVIRKSAGQVVIATHAYGGTDKNEATPIGQFGNDYDAYLSVFTKQYPVVGEFGGIQLLNLFPATTPVPNLAGYFPSLVGSSGPDAENSIGVLRCIERNVSVAGEVMVAPRTKRSTRAETIVNGKGVGVWPADI